MRAIPLSLGWLLAAGVFVPALHAQAPFDAGAKLRQAVAPTHVTAPTTTGAASLISGMRASRKLRATNNDASRPPSWISGDGGCRVVTLRWAALGAVLGFVMPLARHAVGSERPSSGDVVGSTVIGTGAGVVTGAVLCRQTRTRSSR